MSRKDLSRTVIEGGRYYHNSFFRRASHGMERTTTRAWLERVSVDLDTAEASVAEPIWHVRKMFRDKLGPAHRWLAAQVGRPWDKVYSELRERFDSRTIAGAHVVNDHMRDWVRQFDDPRPRYHGRYLLLIDRHGILRRPPQERHGREFTREVKAWAADRVCALTYRGWWWFERRLVERCQSYTCPKEHVVIPIVGSSWQSDRCHEIELTSQRGMTRGERRYLERLPEPYRLRLVIPSPWPAR